MTTEPQHSETEPTAAMNAAEELYRWMADKLKDHEGKDFLPANVACDYAGMRYFINGMAERIAVHVATARAEAVREHSQHVKEFMEELSEYLGIDSPEAKPADFIKAASDIRERCAEDRKRIAELEVGLSACKVYEREFSAIGRVIKSDRVNWQTVEFALHCRDKEIERLRTELKGRA